jgi:hypothetical protein
LLNEPGIRYSIHLFLNSLGTRHSIHLLPSGLGIKHLIHLLLNESGTRHSIHLLPNGLGIKHLIHLLLNEPGIRYSIHLLLNGVGIQIFNPPVAEQFRNHWTIKWHLFRRHCEPRGLLPETPLPQQQPGAPARPDVTARPWRHAADQSRPRGPTACPRSHRLSSRYDRCSRRRQDGARQPVHDVRVHQRVRQAERWVASASSETSSDPSVCCSVTTLSLAKERAHLYKQIANGTFQRRGHAALCYKPEGQGFQTRWGEWIYLIHPAALGPGVYSASDRNEYQTQGKNVSGEQSAAGAWEWQPKRHLCADYLESRQCGIFNISQPYSSPRPVAGIAGLYLSKGSTTGQQKSMSLMKKYRRMELDEARQSLVKKLSAFPPPVQKGEDLEIKTTNLVKSCL